jgi:proteic killer suppression protein
MVRAKKLGLRLDELAAAQVLEDIRKLGLGNPHELKQDRKGQIAINLDGPFRLIFEPSDDPPAKKADGGIDWTAVKSVRILEVADYHGE